MKAQSRLTLSLLLGASLLVGSSLRAETPGPKFLVGSQPSDTRALRFDEILGDSIEIELADKYPALHVFAAGATLANAKPLCVLTPTEKKLVLTRGSSACGALDPLWSGGALKLLLGLPGSTSVIQLSYDPPPAYGPIPTIDVIEQKAEKKAPGKSGTAAPPVLAEPTLLPPIFPAAVVLSAPPPGEAGPPNCVLFINKWYRTRCAGGQPIALGEVKAAVEASLRADKAVPLYADVWENGRQGFRKLELKKKAAPTSDGDEPTPAPAAPKPLADRCNAAFAPPNEYRVCVDARSSGVSRVMVLDCEKKTEETCLDIGGELRPNRKVRVFIWHDDTMDAEAVISGDLGYTTNLYDGTRGGGTKQASGVHSLAGPPGREPKDVEPPQTELSFSPLKLGTHDLTVTISPKPKAEAKKEAAAAAADTTPKIAPIKRALYVRGEYWGALRLGLGFFWTPAAQDVGVATTPNGQRYVAITGADPSVPKPELVTGLTWFVKNVEEGSTDLNFGFGFRLGLLSIADGKVGALESLSVGFEAGKGLDFALGVYGGARLITIPQNGYEPGTLLTATSVPTQKSVAGMLGVVLSVTPDFMKSIGMKQ